MSANFAHIPFRFMTHALDVTTDAECRRRPETDSIKN
jgi:hypothetical protein